MAIAKDGILGGFSGKVGNIVGLTLNGVPIIPNHAVEIF